MNPIESLTSKIPLRSEAKSSAVLFAEGFKVVGLGFMAGQRLAQHSSSTTAFLMILEGNIDFTMNGETVLMRTGDTIAIPAKEEHSVLATENSRILLIKGA